MTLKKFERNSLTLFVKKAITSKKVCIILQAVKNALMLLHIFPATFSSAIGHHKNVKMPTMFRSIVRSFKRVLPFSAREVPSLTGNLVSLLSGGILAVLVSLFSGKAKEGPEVWEKTRDIDNPLSPWTELYAK